MRRETLKAPRKLRGAPNDADAPTEGPSTSANEGQGKQDAVVTKANNKKRPRVPTNIFEFEQRSSKKGKEKVERKESKKGGESTRPYMKSGLYSKDPVKAAMAREKANLPPAKPKNEGGNKAGKCCSPEICKPDLKCMCVTAVLQIATSASSPRKQTRRCRS